MHRWQRRRELQIGGEERLVVDQKIGDSTCVLHSYFIVRYFCVKFVVFQDKYQDVDVPYVQIVNFFSKEL